MRKKIIIGLVMFLAFTTVFFENLHNAEASSLEADLKIIKFENQNSGILFMEKTSNGDVLIGLSDDKIYTYDKKGTFKYGLSFDKNDGKYSFHINNNNEIEIFYVRGGYLVTYSLEGKFIKYKHIPSGSKLNDFYINLQSLEKISFDNVIFLRKGLFLAPGFGPTGNTQLVHKEQNQKEKTIYDSSSESRKNIIKTFVFIFILITGVVIGAIYTVKEYKKKKLNEIKS